MDTVLKHLVMGCVVVMSLSGLFCSESMTISYMIGFPELIHQSLNNIDLHTVIVNTGTGTAAVTLRNQSGPIADFLLVSNSFQIHNISTTLLNLDSQKGSKGIRVCSNESVTVVGISRDKRFWFSSMDGFSGIEYASLGKKYFAVMANVSSQILIIGTMNDTSVTIQLRSSLNSVTYDGKRYNNKDIIQEFVHEFGTIQLQSNGDLTGTSITATYPVSVLSGNIWFGFAKGTTEGSYLVEQLPPLTQWGKRYVLQPPKEFGYICKIVAGYNDTVVHFNCSGDKTDSIDLNNSGDSYTLDQTVNISVCVVTANKAVLVAMITSMKGEKDPSLIIIQPLKRIQGSVFYVLPEASVELVLTTTENNASIFLDNNQILQDFISIEEGLFGLRVTVDEGIRVLHVDNSSLTVSGYLHGIRALSNSFGAFGFPFLPYNQILHEATVTDPDPSTSPVTPATLTDHTSPPPTQHHGCEPCICYTSFTDEQLTDRLIELRQKLAVKQNQTNRFLRSKTSASDKRTSSVACGVVAGTMLVALGGSMLAADIGRVLGNLK